MTAKEPEGTQSLLAPSRIHEETKLSGNCLVGGSARIRGGARITAKGPLLRRNPWVFAPWNTLRPFVLLCSEAEYPLRGAPIVGADSSRVRQVSAFWE